MADSPIDYQHTVDLVKQTRDARNAAYNTLREKDEEIINALLCNSEKVVKDNAQLRNDNTQLKDANTQLQKNSFQLQEDIASLRKDKKDAIASNRELSKTSGALRRNYDAAKQESEKANAELEEQRSQRTAAEERRRSLQTDLEQRGKESVDHVITIAGLEAKVEQLDAQKKTAIEARKLIVARKIELESELKQVKGEKDITDGMNKELDMHLQTARAENKQTGQELAVKNKELAAKDDEISAL